MIDQEGDGGGVELIVLACGSTVLPLSGAFARYASPSRFRLGACTL